MSRKTERVAELIREEVGRLILEDLSDPRVGFVTVTRVEVAPDLSAAKVFVSVLGEATDGRTTLRGLQSCAKRLQLRLAERVTLRRVPHLVFHLDEGVKRSLHMSSLLQGLAREREALQASQPPAEEEAGSDDE